MYSFVAHDVSAMAIPDLESYVVAIYDSAQNPGFGIEIQKSLEFEPQDQDLGINTYCVSLPDGRVHYGGVTDIRLDANRLTIGLSEEASTALDEEGFDIILDDPSNQVDIIVNGLTIIFRDELNPPPLTIDR